MVGADAGPYAPAMVQTAERWQRLLLPAGLGEPDDAPPPRRSVRDWLVDLACLLFALSVGLALFAGVNVDPGLSERAQALDLLVGGLSLLALGWRRRFPVALALAVAAGSAVSASSAGTVLVLLFTVGVRRPPPVALAVCALACVPVPIYEWLHPSRDSAWWFGLVIGLTITAAVLAWGMWVRVRRQLVVSLTARARQAEADQALRLEAARAEERTRIAREMHDVLAHRLSLLSLHAGALEFRPDAQPDEVATAAAIVRASAHEALQELREVIGVLRQDELGEPPERPQPTLAELDALLDESRRAGVRVEAEVAVAAPGPMPAGLGRNAYRIVQEALTNARKHAPGSVVHVRVMGGPRHGLTVAVRNPLPVGVPAGGAPPGAGTGLVGLRERTQLAGGRLRHGPGADGRFEVEAWLPWPA